MGALTNLRRATPAVLAAAAAAAVIASVPAPSAEAASPLVFTFPAITQAPAQVAGLPAGVQQVATGIGGNYGLALLPGGTVSGWGVSASANSFGELGDGTTINHTSPAPVRSLTGITSIAGGGSHALAIGAGGTVWAWGDNANGQLGDGTTTTRLTPVQVPGLTGITQLSGGELYSLALRSDGTVWAWGDNISGELGDGTTTQHHAPEQVPGLSGITQIAAGNSSSFAVRSDGTLFAWGNNNAGQLGDGSTASRSTPEQVPGLTGVVQVATGLDHTLAITGPDHAVWGWGDNSAGEVGDGSKTTRSRPVALSLSGASQVAAGVFESAAVRSDGTLLTWGDQILAPAAVSSLTGVTQVSLGDAIDLIIGQSAFVAVPDLGGDTTAQAGATLQAAGLVLGSVSSAVDNTCNNIGTVLRQSPAAGTTLHIGSAVSITIGTRPKTPCP
jgi:alpha-tubulin suppressor-like RCC1 family protein